MEYEGNKQYFDLKEENTSTYANSNETQESQESQEIQFSDPESAIRSSITELFKTPDDEPYATINKGDAELSVLIGGSEFNDFAHQTSFEKTGKAPNKYALEEITLQIAAEAKYRGKTHDVFHRVGGDGKNEIVIDLGGDDGRCVCITKDGWSLTKPNRKMRRSKTMKPLPEPTYNGSFAPFWDIVNVEGDKDKALLTGWLLGCLRPKGPYPIMMFQAEKDSGKSSAMDFCRRLIDPAVGIASALPRTEQDLYIAAHDSWVLSYDNLVGIKGTVSDMFCRMATGGAFKTRKLYTTTDQVVIEASRPMILNGIEDIASRADLISRSLIVRLPRIKDEARRSLDQLEQKFVELQPQLLGALCDAAVIALREQDDATLPQLPRMADFGKFVTAGEQRLGIGRGFIVQAMIDGQKQNDIDAVMMDDVAVRLIEFVGSKSNMFWKGTMTQLLGAITPDRAPRSWPMTPRVLSQRLNHLEPQLREIGIEIDRKGGKTKTISIHIVDPSCVACVSCDSEYAGLSDNLVIDPVSHEVINLDDLPFTK